MRVQMPPSSVCTLDSHEHGRWLPSPFGFPPHAWLQSNARRCAAMPSIEAELRQAVHDGHPSWLPVFHTTHDSWCRDRHSAECSDPHFYHLATGCSDMYVVAPNNSIVIGNNRADVTVQLLARRHKISLHDATAQLSKEVGGGCGLHPMAFLDLWRRISACRLQDNSVARSTQRDVHPHRRLVGERTNQTALSNSSTSPAPPSIMRAAHPTLASAWNATSVATGAVARPSSVAPLHTARGTDDLAIDIDAALCVHIARRNIGQLNAILLPLLRETGVSTAVLLYEAPGGDLLDFKWKTEVVRSAPASADVFYDAGARRCDPWYRSHATCVFCTLRSPRTYYACRGHAHEHTPSSNSQPKH